MYNPLEWFWVVGGDTSRAWSSATGAYVDAWDAERVTRIASEDELRDVLAAYGLASPVTTVADYVAAIEAHIDGVASAKSYSGAVSLASYVNSTIPQWAAEAAAFIAWRDGVWAYAYAEFAKVQGGQRAQPTVAEIIAELPSITWPA